MFILPAHAAPFAAVASLDGAAQREWWTLPLTLLILALVRAVTVTALFYGRRAQALPLAVLEKGGLKPAMAPTVVPGPTTGRRLLPFLGSSPATPAAPAPAPDAAPLPSSPLSQAPPEAAPLPARAPSAGPSLR